MAFFFFLLYLIVLYIRPAEWIPIFFGMQLADITLIGAAVFLAFGMSFRKTGFIRVPHNLMLMWLFGAILMSHAIHTYVEGFTTSFTSFGTTAVTYFLILHTVTTPRKLKITLSILVVLTAILAFQGVDQAASGYGWAGQSMTEDGRIRWISIFSDPNDLALAFVVVVPLLLAYLTKPLFFAAKLVPLSLLGLLLYAVYLTNSRGGILGLVAAIVFFFIKRSKYVVPGGIIGGVFATLVFLFGPSRMGAMSAQDSSALGRLEAWYYGFGLLKSSPLFGVGRGMFTDSYPLTAHNSFILAAAELGMFGLFFWVGLLYASFKGLSRVQRHVRQLAPYAFGLQAGLVGFMASALFLSRTYNELPYLLCALSAALYYIGTRESDQVAFRLERRDLWNIGLFSLGSLVLVQIAMKTWL